MQKLNTPMLVLGLGLGAGAAYMLFWPKEDDLDPADLDNINPEDWAFDEGEFGWWWATRRGKARRRDRKLRRAARRTDRYNKCVEKKGADHKRCQRILKYSQKSVARAQKLDDKLLAKGRTAQARFVPSGFATITQAAVSAEEAPSPAGGEVYQDDMELVGPVSDLPASGGAPMGLIVVGGLALLGVGGFLIYTMTKKPKRKKRKKRRKPAGARKKIAAAA